MRDGVDRESKELTEDMTEAGKGQAPQPGQTKDRSEQAGSDPRGSDRLAQGMEKANEWQSGSGSGQTGR